MGSMLFFSVFSIFYVWWSCKIPTVIHVLLGTLPDIRSNKLLLCTALHVSAWKGNDTMVKLLIGYKVVEPHFKDSFSCTPLARAGHSDIVQILLDRLTGEPEHVKDLPIALQVVVAFCGQESVV